MALQELATLCDWQELATLCDLAGTSYVDLAHNTHSKVELASTYKDLETYTGNLI